jgi:hypothetical protein
MDEFSNGSSFPFSNVENNWKIFRFLIGAVSVRSNSTQSAIRLGWRMKVCFHLCPDLVNIVLPPVKGSSESN